MRIILDTDKKTVTVPWNYSDKLAEINALIVEYGGPEAKTKGFTEYLKDCWNYAMEHSDTHLKTAQKPAKADKKEGK